MKPSLAQQALAGVAVLVVIAVTLIGGVVLAASDNPGSLLARRTATPTTRPTALSQAASATSPSTLALQPTDTTAPSAIPQATATATQMPSWTPLPSSTAQPNTTTCAIQTGWVPYMVQIGDTLSGIGYAYGASVDQMKAGNCLSSSMVYAGQVLYVPPVTPLATARPTNLPTDITPTAGPSPTPSGSDGKCTNLNSIITSPAVGQILTGNVSFYGTATHGDFNFYKLELRQEGASTRQDWITFVTSYDQVVNGYLGELLTAAFPNGEYWVRLVVVDHRGSFPEPCSKLYVIQN